MDKGQPGSGCSVCVCVCVGKGERISGVLRMRVFVSRGHSAAPFGRTRRGIKREACGMFPAVVNSLLRLAITVRIMALRHARECSGLLDEML